MRISGTIDGVDEVIRRLKQLDVRMRTRLIKQAVFASAAVIMKAARVSYITQGIDDKGTERNLAKNIKMKARKARVTPGGQYAVDVGVYGPRSGPMGVPHWSLLEFGTSKMQARPFMRPAIENNVQAAYDAAFKRLKKALKI